MTLSPDELAAVPAAGRRRNPLKILGAQNKSRLTDLIPVRQERMAATPFTYFRGAAAPMASDLSLTPNSGIVTQICGDAHLSNFGFFFSPERRLVFDINDFDETYPGPFEWDIKRLAASIVVAAEGNGFDTKTAVKISEASAKAYRKAMRSSAKKSELASWYDHVDSLDLMNAMSDRLDTVATDEMAKAMRKARHRNSTQALSKLCTVDGSGVHIRYSPPLLMPADKVLAGIPLHMVDAVLKQRFEHYKESLPHYLAGLVDRYEFVEAARKVVGVGSVGTRCWIALFAGRESGDPLFLQMKEAQQSVIARFTDSQDTEHQGKRVVHGQQLLQASSDILLGWLTAPGFQSDKDGKAEKSVGQIDFYVRQLRDGKGSVVIEALSPAQLTHYGEVCGMVLAQAHARTSARGEIADYLGETGKNFDSAIAEFAGRYARINAEGHAALVDAIAAGQLKSAALES